MGKRELGFNLMNQDGVKMDTKDALFTDDDVEAIAGQLVDTCKIIFVHKSLGLTIVHVLTLA